jgi:hypothetical protein
LLHRRRKQPAGQHHHRYRDQQKRDKTTLIQRNKPYSAGGICS